MGKKKKTNYKPFNPDGGSEQFAQKNSKSKSTNSNKKDEAPNINGFYFDKDLNRYFPLHGIHKLPVSSNSLQNLLYGQNIQEKPLPDQNPIKSKETILREKKKKHYKLDTIQFEKKIQKIRIPTLKRNLSLDLNLRNTFTTISNEHLSSMMLIPSPTQVTCDSMASHSFALNTSKFTTISPMLDKNVLLFGTVEGDLCQMKLGNEKDRIIESFCRNTYNRRADGGRVTSISRISENDFIYSTMGSSQFPGTIHLSSLGQTPRSFISFEKKSIYTTSSSLGYNYFPEGNKGKSDANEFLVGGSKFISLYSKNLEKKFELETKSDIISSCIFDENGAMLIGGCRNGYLDFFDTRVNNFRIGSVKAHTAGIIQSLKWSSNYIFTSAMDNNICLWDIRWPTTPTFDKKPKPPKMNKVGSYKPHSNTSLNSLSLALSPNMNVVSSVDSDNTVRIWDVVTSKLLKTIQADFPVDSLCFIPKLYKKDYRNSDFPISMLVLSNNLVYRYD
ncbi:hypothetical protein BB559_004754 [Furculomyces boomerangus]|uniref:Uncharacterized protein n=2 Tax=Harpellales TaxID=61421 RepID=A0A2T9YCU9_9FUNG|nr:hypothetical protein BB559_004754 [Furculomyces boomerangus]PVZ99250.1 hypothetical protein BB558_004743 [Smittium angustum]